MPRIYDVSVPVRHGGVVYPGNPAIAFTPQQRIADGGSSNVTTLTLGSHTGTHVDAPRHFADDGAPVDALPLERLIGTALLIAMADEVRAIGADQLRGLPIAGHTRLLLRTRNSRLLHDAEFHRDYTYLAPDGAEYLVGLGVELVGVDYYSVEQFRSGHHRTHRTLLGAGVVIIEGLDLSVPPPGEYELCCLPLRLEGLDGAPARVILIEQDT
jgi:arylformamidase